MKMKKVLSIIEIFLLMLFLCIPSFAAEPNGTIHLHSSIEVDGQEVCFSGDEFSLVKIADAAVIEKDGSVFICYENHPNYQEFGNHWDALTSVELRNTAKQLEKIAAEHQDYLMTEVVDAYGNASFTNLPPALYLVVCTKVNPQNGDHYMDPFFISIPTLWDDSVLYDVNCFPKNGLIEPDPEVPPEKGKQPGLSQTGQLKWPIPLLALSGSILIVVGRFLIVHENKNKK